ncbi:hypothetical protein LTR65_011031 [Meristemomyces frigidus]
MDSSPLLTLPPELRLMVYEFALTHPESIELEYLVHPDQKIVASGTQPHLLALAQTCAQTRGECGNIFFRENSVTLRVTGFPERITDPTRKIKRFRPLRIFNRAIGAANAAALRSTTVHLGTCSPYDLRGAHVSVVLRDVFQEGLEATTKESAQEITLNVVITPVREAKTCEDRQMSVVINLKDSSASTREINRQYQREVLEGKWGRDFFGSPGFIQATLDVLQEWWRAASRLSRTLHGKTRTAK